MTYIYTLHYVSVHYDETLTEVKNRVLIGVTGHVLKINMQRCLSFIN